MPKEEASHKCLSLIMVDSVVKAKKKQRKSIILKHIRRNANMNQKRQKWRTLLMMIQKKVHLTSLIMKLIMNDDETESDDEKNNDESNE